MNREIWSPPLEYFSSDIDLNRFFYESNKFNMGNISDSILLIKEPSNSDTGVIIYRDPLFLFAHLNNNNTNESSLASYIHVVESRWSNWIEFYESRYSFFPLLEKDVHVILMVHTIEEKSYLERMNINFVYPFGGGSWISPNVFKPIRETKKYDLLMVASSNMPDKVKKWSIFLNLVEKLKLNAVLLRRDKEINHLDKETPLQMAIRLNIQNRVEIINRTLDREEMNFYYNQSKFTCVFSHREGFNRSFSESICANTPTLLIKGSIPVPEEFVNEHTGIYIDPTNFSMHLWLDILNKSNSMKPREWAIEHIAARKSTQILEEYLIKYCHEYNLPWQNGICVHYNNPRKTLTDT